MNSNDFDWSECPSVLIDPERLSGAPVFCGTRVPVSALFNNLASGATIEDFMEWFPGATREQIGEVLSFAATKSAAPVKSGTTAPSKPGNKAA